MAEATDNIPEQAAMAHSVSGSSGEEDDTTGPRDALSRLLACCGLLKTPSLLQLPNSNGHQDYEEATYQLLRRKSCSTTSTGHHHDFTRIQHIRQMETWDCGIACLQMVLMWLRDLPKKGNSSLVEEQSESSLEQFTPQQIMERDILLQKVSTQSIWTVDLLILLENILAENDSKNNNNNNNNNNNQSNQSPPLQLKPNHDNTTYLFCSQVMGVNQEHSTTGYYEKAFTTDSERVNKLCKEVNRRQLPVLWPYHLGFSQLIDLISTDHCVAIILVDNNHLIASTCVTSTDDNNNNNTTTQQQQEQDASYMGHYVILCGISRNPDHLIQAFNNNNNNNNNTSSEINPDEEDEEGASSSSYNSYCIAVVNPGISDPITFVNPQKLERAWRADGTDCDVVFVAKHHGATEMPD